MSTYSYSTILKKARECKKAVETKQSMGIGSGWAYYIAKAIQNPNKPITRITFDKAKKPQGTYISTQIYKKDYLDCAKRLTYFVEKNKRLPNFITWGDRKIRVRDYVYMFSKILVFYQDHNKTLPAYNNINSKAYIKPSEYYQEIYDYFAKKFGFKPKTLDDLLAYVRDNFDYEFYSDDKKSNKEVMDSQAGNCTDLLQWLCNMAQAMGYDWICVHVECRVSGIGHVWGKFRHKTYTENAWINRDPSAVCGNSIRNMWCEDGYLLAENPSWWLENLKR